MRVADADYIQALNSGKPIVNYATFVLYDGTVKNLAPADFRISGNTFTDRTTDSSSFSVGSFIGKTVNICIDNTSGNFDNVDFYMSRFVLKESIVVTQGTSEVVKHVTIGNFTVVTDYTPGTLINFNAVDDTYLFDKVHNLTGTKTLKEIVREACSQCLGSPTFDGTGNFDLYNTQIDTSKLDAKLTWRQIISYIAIMTGYNAYIDSNELLKFKWYDDTVFEQGTANEDYWRISSYKGLQLGTYDISITGVRVTNGDTSVEKPSQTTYNYSYVIEVKDNPLCEGIENTIANHLGAKLNDFTFRIFDCNILCNPLVEAGDMALVVDTKNVAHRTLINDVSFQTNGFTKVACKAENIIRQQASYTSPIAKAVVEANRNTARQLTAYDESVQRMNRLAQNANGIYTAKVEKSDGSIIYYESDHPITYDLNGEAVFVAHSHVWKNTDAGHFYSTDSGISDIATTWTYGVDREGNAVMNTVAAIGLLADWIVAGELTLGGSKTNPANAELKCYDQSDNLIATINKNGITMYQGVIESDDYSYTSGHFSDDGTRFDVTNDYLRSKYFSFDMNGAYINGQIEATTGHIGGATITQDAIKVIGNIELYSGSGTFQFRPTDYYFAEDFPLYLSTEGSCTVVLSDHISGSDYVIATYNVDSTGGVETVPLNHLIGTNPDDYYQVEVTGSPCVVSALNVILAYMGEEGFKGILEGVVRGYVDSDAGRLGHLSYSRASDYLKSDTDFNISVVDSQDNEGEMRITPTYLRYLNHYGDKIFFEHDNVKNNSKITREVSGRDSHVVWSDDMANEMFGQFAVQGINIRLSQTSTGTINIDFNPLKYDTANDPYAADPTLPLADGAVVLIYE